MQSAAAGLVGSPRSKLAFQTRLTSPRKRLRETSGDSSIENGASDVSAEHGHGLHKIDHHDAMKMHLGKAPV